MANTRSVTKKPAAHTATPATETVKTPVAKAKTFEEHEGIECVSCTAGELVVEGLRTKTLYDWHGIGDVIEVEYGDLISMVRARSPYVFKPRFIIRNDDFVKENKTVKEFYENMYTIDDLNEIVNMPADKIKEVLPQLPIGAQDALKGIVGGAVDSGTLDSISKIRVFDEFFKTNMLLKIKSE
jgi:hypothetical protein